MSIKVNHAGAWWEVSKEEFLDMVSKGVVRPDTEVIVKDQKVVAAKVKGLVFPGNVNVPSSSSSPNSQDTVNLSGIYPQQTSVAVQADEPVNIAAVSPPKLHGNGTSKVDEPAKIVAVPVVAGHAPSQLSRAVFIFLAVFVGLFGVHDFYAKRVQYGWIHLSLLLPWVLTFIVSVLIVFGYSLYVWCYIPYRKEIRECQIALKTCGKDIKETEQEIAELRQRLDEAKAGKLLKPKEVTSQPQKPREITPRQDKTRTVIPQQDEPTELVPQQNEPRVREVIPQSQVEIDRELVRELERQLRELERTLNDLKQHQDGLEVTLSGLRLKQGAEGLSAWLSTGPLWLYFFFFVLPFASWVMAMVEIVYVTKDGTGREFCF